MAAPRSSSSTPSRGATIGRSLFMGTILAQRTRGLLGELGEVKGRLDRLCDGLRACSPTT